MKHNAAFGAASVVLGSGEIDNPASSKTAAPPATSPLDFAVECWAQRTIARAVLYFEGILDLHMAVDGAWEAAENAGLVAIFGPDEIQASIALAFDRGDA